ncbi:uncharacterized protein LOC143298149 [Babylonia areolata]|uniref:uncharacterized protein LOC143298149 n=1 Tax=Babylonia areolata TaxID=304850 RepID=UPI003FD2F17B
MMSVPQNAATFILLLLLSLTVTRCHATRFHCPDYPFRNVSLPWATRVDNLVSLLTLTEVQLQMARGGHGRDVSPAPPIPHLGVGPYSWNTECLRGVVNAGPATSFPQALGLAATFSPELVFRVARATGLEARAKYNNYTRTGVYGDSRGLSCFAPVINIMRDPRWGRNQETYGEDPILSSILAASFVRGLQGNDSRYVLTNAGCKHFDVYGGPENIPVSRVSFDARVSEVDWHQTFLPAFKACVEAGTFSLMCSYNSINGVPACANHRLLTEILRDEWGFTGYVISDEKALERIVTAHNYSKDFVTAAAAAVNAGVNLEISGNLVNNVMMNVVEAVKRGLLKEATVRERVKPLFYTRMRLGEFDPPAMNPYTRLDLSLIQSPAHQALSLEAAKNSFVLLKNKGGFLPIGNDFNHVAVVGPMADNPEWLYGDYSPTVNVTLTVTPVQGLRQVGQSLTTAQGCDDPRCQTYSSSQVKAAVAGADIVFVCLGTGQPVEGENRDRPDLELPGQQLQLLKDAVSFSGGAPVVLLLFNAGPLNVTWADQHASVPAILECWFPAQSAGTALLQVLTNQGGHSSPAGRLPATWPLLADQIPDMVNYSMSGRTYRYSQGPSLYPFGYGLSYTTFRYSDLVTPKTLTPGHDLPLTLTVSNTGDLAADEVVQIYVQWPQSPGVQTPGLQLVAIRRVTTRPHGAVKLRFQVPGKYLAVYTDQHSGWTYLPGTMRVYAGGQQPRQRSVGSNVISADVIMTKALPDSSASLLWMSEN